MKYKGGDYKFSIDIKVSGFSMERDDFTIVLINGKKKLTLHKRDLVRSESGVWYICFSSDDIGAGDVTIVVYAHVPDDDFKDGIRTEIFKDNFCHIDNI